jgi:hypothetical protein
MHRRSHAVVWLVLALAAAACAPGAPASPRTDANSADSERRPERTLAVAVRGEPPSVAPGAPEVGGIKLKTSIRLFNAALDLVDDRGVAGPYLAEALPQLNTDSW